MPTASPTTPMAVACHATVPITWRRVAPRTPRTARSRRRRRTATTRALATVPAIRSTSTPASASGVRWSRASDTTSDGRSPGPTLIHQSTPAGIAIVRWSWRSNDVNVTPGRVWTTNPLV